MRMLTVIGLLSVISSATLEGQERAHVQQKFDQEAVLTLSESLGTQEIESVVKGVFHSMQFQQEGVVLEASEDFWPILLESVAGVRTQLRGEAAARSLEGGFGVFLTHLVEHVTVREVDERETVFLTGMDIEEYLGYYSRCGEIPCRRGCDPCDEFCDPCDDCKGSVHKLKYR